MRKTSVALLCTAILIGCGGTRTCVLTGLPQGVTYNWVWVDGDGETHTGTQAVDTNGTITITNIDNNVECGDIDLERLLIALDIPPER